MTAHLERRKQAELPKEPVIIYISYRCGFRKLFHETLAEDWPQRTQNGRRFVQICLTTLVLPTFLHSLSNTWVAVAASIGLRKTLLSVPEE